MVEFLYHVDKDDNIIGKIEREEAHLKKILHRSGGIVILNKKGETFIAKRNAQKKIFPNCYDLSCAFHVKYGQSYESAAIAELNEENHLSIKSNELEFIGKFLLNEAPDYMVGVVYKVVTDKVVEADESELSEGKFCSVEEVRRILKEEKTTNWFRGSWKLYNEKLI